MPSYLTAINDSDRGRLRSNIKPPLHGCEEASSHMSAMRGNRLDRLSLKCTIEAKSPAFKTSFFYRTHLIWNRLPKEIRELDNVSMSQKKLKHHMWDVVLDPC